MDATAEGIHSAIGNEEMIRVIDLHHNQKEYAKILLIVAIGVIILIVFVLVKPAMVNTSSANLGNIGLPVNALEELKKILGH